MSMRTYLFDHDDNNDGRHVQLKHLYEADRSVTWFAFGKHGGYEAVATYLWFSLAFRDLPQTILEDWA